MDRSLMTQSRHPGGNILDFSTTRFSAETDESFGSGERNHAATTRMFKRRVVRCNETSR